MYGQETPKKIEAFCEALSESCNVGKACLSAGISRGTAYKWRNADPDFASAWDEAMRIGVTALEDEAHRRAFDGIEKAIVHQGVITDTVLEYSDTLAIFLLKAHAPDKYRERSDVNLKAAVAVDAMTEDEIREELAQLAALGIVSAALPAQDDGTDLV